MFSFVVLNTENCHWIEINLGNKSESKLREVTY